MYYTFDELLKVAADLYQFSYGCSGIDTIAGTKDSDELNIYELDMISAASLPPANRSEKRKVPPEKKA